MADPIGAARTMGRNGPEVSALGMGCWAIGGPWRIGGSEAGWGDVDDSESIRAVHAAIDAGITWFDTAANYGAGRSERVLAQRRPGAPLALLQLGPAPQKESHAVCRAVLGAQQIGRRPQVLYAEPG